VRDYDPPKDYHRVATVTDAQLDYCVRVGHKYGSA